MFVVENDMTINVTRGDSGAIIVRAIDMMDNEGEKNYEFQAGEVIRLKVFEKKACENVVLQKDFPIEEATEMVTLYLTEHDTRFGEIISKPTDYWYEIELNPFTEPQTIVGYDGDGAKIFRLYPEGKDVEYVPPTEEEIGTVDAELSLISERPIQNQAVARAIVELKTKVEGNEKRATESISNTAESLNVLTARVNNMAKLTEGSTTADAELLDIRVGADGTIYDTAGSSVRGQVSKLNNMLLGRGYTNLLESIAMEDSTTSKPTSFPCHKVGVVYEPSWRFDFEARASMECYIFSAQQGDRFNMSGFDISTASSNPAVITILDSDFSVVQYFDTALKATSFACGLYACPENTAYVIINKAMDGNVPVVTRVDEPVFETLGGFIPGGTKCVSALYNSINHATYYGNAGSSLTNVWKADSVSYYSDGIYPLEEGTEYVLYIPESIAYNIWGLVCNESLIVNKQITDESFDKNRRYVFTATAEDKYIALNCYDFNTIQFGENKCNKIKAGACIGNAFFDGKNDVSLKEIGVIDRSLADKKWISYGDSITRGVGVDFVNGEKRWQDYIVERYNIGTHIEMGEGYTSLAHKDGELGACYCDDSRLNALINESPDIVTILGGANDYRFGIPLGTNEHYETKDTTTFIGAYSYIIDRILTAKPDTLIIILGMFENTMGAYAPGLNSPPLNLITKATKDIAKHFGLPFVDLNECGFNKYNFNTTNGIFSTDGIHPNKEGAKRVAMVVSKWFDTFKGTIY